VGWSAAVHRFRFKNDASPQSGRQRLSHPTAVDCPAGWVAFHKMCNLELGCGSVWVGQPTMRDKIRTGSAATSQRLNVDSLHLKPHFSLDVGALECSAGRCAPSSDFVLTIRSTLRQSSRTEQTFQTDPLPGLETT